MAVRVALSRDHAVPLVTVQVCTTIVLTTTDITHGEQDG